MLQQQQLKETSRDKNSQLQQSHILNSSESILSLAHKTMNYFCLTRFVGFWPKYLLTDNEIEVARCISSTVKKMVVELLPRVFKPKLKQHDGDEMQM